MIASVVVDIIFEGQKNIYDFNIPSNIINLLKGMRVLVKFNNSIRLGYVLDIKNNSEYENLNDILEVLDDYPILNSELLKYFKYFNDTTTLSYSEIISTIIPSAYKLDYYNEVEIIDKSKIDLNILNLFDSNNKFIFNIKDSSKYENLFKLKNKNIVKITKIYKEKHTTKKLKTKNYTTRLNEYNLNSRDIKFISKLSNKKYYIIDNISDYSFYYQIIYNNLIINKSTMIVFDKALQLDIFYKQLKKVFNDNVVKLEGKTDLSKMFQTYIDLKNINNNKIVLTSKKNIFTPINNLNTILYIKSSSPSYSDNFSIDYDIDSILDIKSSIYDCRYLVVSSNFNYKIDNIYYRYDVFEKISKTIFIETKNNIDLIDDNLLFNIKNMLNNKKDVLLFLNKKGYSSYLKCLNCFNYQKCDKCNISYKVVKENDIDYLYCSNCVSKIKLDNKCLYCNNDNLMPIGLNQEAYEIELNKKLLNKYEIHLINNDNKSSIKNIKKSVNPKIIISTNKIFSIDIKNILNIGLIVYLKADDDINLPTTLSEQKFLDNLLDLSSLGNDLKIYVQINYIDKYNIIKYIKNNDYINYLEYIDSLRNYQKLIPYYYTGYINIYTNKVFDTYKQINQVLESFKLKNIIISNPKVDVIPTISKYRSLISIKIKYSKKDDIYYIISTIKQLKIDETKITYIEESEEK